MVDGKRTKMASTKQFIEKRDNIASIISFIRDNKAVTRLEISSGLALSWACVSDLISLLIEQKIVLESKKKSDARAAEAVGRVPMRLTLNPQKYFLGIDINATGIAITILDLNGQKRNYRKWDAEILHNTEELGISICDKIRVMLGENSDDCCGIGVAMQGACSDGSLWTYPIHKGYVKFDPKAVIENCFSLPVFVRHDPECMLYAVMDSIFVDSMAVRVDNDIGVAVMKKGRILEAPLELGHIYVGNKKLKAILNDSESSGDYMRIAEELGLAVANLAKLLGLKKVFIVGEIIEWFDKVEEQFFASFRRASSSIECVVSNAVDASCGAALVAMLEYPAVSKEKRY